MNFSTPSAVENVVWTMKLADIPRGTNRSLINNLMNGFPPYTTQEAEENNINTNVNFLEGTKIVAEARRQFSNAFLKPGNFFSVDLDRGPTHKRREWSRIITKEINKQLKQSLPYLESLRSTFASVVLHGIGPTVWPDKEHWVPVETGIEDVLIPSGTRLSMQNLQYFAVYQQYTPAQLWKATHGAKVDPGWNLSLVNSAIKWADDQYQAQLPYADMFSPEKQVERFKSDLGMYASDAVPTIDSWDFYAWDKAGKQEGWTKRIILDTPTSPELGTKSRGKTIIGTDGGEFLYDAGNRKFASSLREIVHFQFGDASAVAPFRYHTVRSLGFLLYAVCHLQNRLRCKFNDAMFESLLQYFRVANPDDAERITKIDLHNLGVIPEGVEFVKAQDRWQVNEGLVIGGIQNNREIMADAAAGYTQQQDFGKEKTSTTATEVMARVNSANALIGAMLTQAYAYQVFQYREIARRFCKANSTDRDVREFRLLVLKQGVPEIALDCSTWNIEPERVLGAGNKMMEIAIADKLMAVRNLMDPESQREVLHLYIAANSDDDALANRLAPIEQKVISDSVHDAQLATASLMMGLPVALKKGMNHIEYVETLLGNLAILIQRKMQAGGMASPDELAGMQNIAQHIGEHVQIIAQDPNEKGRVKQYMDDLGKLMNEVKGMAQRLQESMQQQQAQGPSPDPETMAKIEAQRITAQAKADNMRESHGQRTAQKQVQWENEEKRKEQQHIIDLRQQVQQNQVDIANQNAMTAAEIRRQGIKAQAEPKPTAPTTK